MPAPARAQGRSLAARVMLVLLALGLGGCAALFGWPPAGTPHEQGPVVVLGGGSGDRFALGHRLWEAGPDPRELVVMADARDELATLDASCAHDAVHCVDPEPHSTYGEALAVDDLARDEGWTSVTVVTSEFHVTRARLLFSYCVDASTRVVASASGLGVGSRVEHALRESLSTLASLPAAGCPGR